MKIHPILSFKLQQPASKDNKNYRSPELSNDLFVKSSNVQFCGKTIPFENKIRQFSQKIKQYVLTSDTIKFDELEKIVTEFSPTTNVKKMSELPSTSNAGAYTSAYFQQKIYFSPDGRMFEDPKTIFLNPPAGKTLEDKATFLDSIVHEMTHIFQEESPDRVSKTNFFNTYLKGKDINSLIGTLSAMPKVFQSVEHNATMPFRYFMNKENNLPKPIKNASSKTLDEAYKSTTALDAKKYVETVVDTIITQAEKQFGPLDRIGLKKFIRLVASKEKEAYSKGLDVQKKVLKINEDTDLDLRLKLYEILEKV